MNKVADDQIMRVAIHGVPRSGTTWLGEIFNSSPLTVYKYQPLFSYAFKGFLTEASSTGQILDFFNKLRVSADDFVDQASYRLEGKLPVPFKEGAATHVVYKEVRYHNVLTQLVKYSPENFRLVLIVRNPLAVINSWLRAPKEFRADKGWKELDEWRFAARKNQGLPEEYNGFEKWKVATRMFLKLGRDFPEKVKVVVYGDLVAKAEEVVEGLFDFCSLPLEDQTVKFLRESRERDCADAYSVFRSRDCDDKWKSQLDGVIVEAIRKDLMDTDLERYL